jgi:protein disulfide-isomerase A1
LSTRLVTLQSQEELKALKNKEPLVAVAYISAKDKANLDTWNQLSEKLIDDFAFGIVTDSSLASVEGITTFPSVVLYKPFDHLRDVHTGPIVPDQIEDFIKVNAVPLLAQIEPSSFMDYVDAGRPLAYIFSNSATMQDEMHQLFLPLAQRYKGRFSFVHIDASLYSSQADFLSLTKNTWPAFAVHNFKSGARFAYQQDKPLTESDVMSFLDTIETGQAEPVVKSQSFIAEESEDAAVKVVVGKNFDKIVFDKTKDVLLEIYAPWCGHCKVLAPIYQQLGEVMQANHAERDHGVVIAKMDGTVNDVPPSAGFEISGFPTIKLFKADGKVIDYSGPRKLHDLARFLNEHSTKQTLRVDLDNLPKRDEKVVVDQHSKRDEL